MIVDSSAIVAVVLQEADFDEILRAMAEAATLRMSAGTYLECTLVLDQHLGPAGRERFDRLLDVLAVQIEQVTVSQARLARTANQRFGRASGHPARLNYGDLFSYALAAEVGEPLLYKGSDFSHTDVTPALPSARQ